MKVQSEANEPPMSTTQFILPLRTERFCIILQRSMGQLRLYDFIFTVKLIDMSVQEGELFDNCEFISYSICDKMMKYPEFDCVICCGYRV